MGKIKTFFTADRQAGNPYKKRFSSFFDFIEKFGGTVKLSVTVLILVLFAADYYTIYDLFKEPQFNFDTPIRVILAGVFAAVLEGLPCLFSASLCKLMDTNIKDKIVRKKQKIIFAISFFAIIFMFALVVYLRVAVLLGRLDPKIQGVLIELINIVRNTDESALKQFLALLGTDKFSADTFLIFSPIITSVFAFALSLGYTSSTHREILRRNVETSNRKSMKANFNKDVVRAKSRTMKQELWNELGIDGTPPDDLDKFCDQTYAAIRHNMVNDGIKAFEIQIDRFNLNVNSELRRCLIRISQCSSVPLEITNIKVNDIIAEYDGIDNNPNGPNNNGPNSGGAAADPFDAWSYSRSINALSEKLRETIIHDGDMEKFAVEEEAIIEDPIEEIAKEPEIINDNYTASDGGFGYGKVSENKVNIGAVDSSVSDSERISTENPQQKESDSSVSDSEKISTENPQQKESDSSVSDSEKISTENPQQKGPNILVARSEENSAENPQQKGPNILVARSEENSAENPPQNEFDSDISNK